MKIEQSVVLHGNEVREILAAHIKEKTGKMAGYLVVTEQANPNVLPSVRFALEDVPVECKPQEWGQEA